MLGLSSFNNRVFVYEVAGLQQNDLTVNNNYQIRSSSNAFIQVPYSRMNEEMQRISRLGGKIVSIQSSTEYVNQLPTHVEDSPADSPENSGD